MGQLKGECASAQRLPATFVDYDCRYAVVAGKVYATLLQSLRKGDDYVEDLRNTDEYPREWCDAFFSVLYRSGRALLVSDASDHYRPLGLFRIDNVSMSNFLTCTIGKRLRQLQLMSG